MWARAVAALAVLVSAAVHLVLSNAADLDRVDELRAASDAILVGAETVRHDDPRLLVRSAARVARRVREGRPAQPVKVTVTARAKLDPTCRFFTRGEAPKLVYCARDTLDMATAQLGGVATVVDGGCDVTLRAVTEDLHDRGVRRLLVEGGGSVHTQLLLHGLADELQLAIAPVFVGGGAFPFSVAHRARLVDTRQVGDVAVLRFALSDRFVDHPDLW